MATKKQQQIGSLELKEGKSGTVYLKGTVFGKDFIAFKAKPEYAKEHPTAPSFSGFEDLDYEDGEKKEYTIAMWSRTSEGGNKYLSGIVDSKAVVAFYDEETRTFRVYEQRKPQPKKPAKKGKRPNTDGLPF